MTQRRSRSRVVAAVSISIVAASLASSVASADPSPSERALSEALFRDGRQLAEAGKWSVACTKFAESERLDPQLGTLLYLATCHEKEGKLASAWIEFTEARTLAAGVGQKEREKIARERASAIEPRLAHVVVTAEDAAPGLEVTLDGNALKAGALGSPLPLDPGEHTLTASAPNREPFTQKFTITAEREEARLAVPRLVEKVVAAAPPPAPPAAPAPPPDEPAEPDGSGQRTLGFVVAGVGVVALGAGAYFGVRALGTKKDADKLCDASFCSQAGLDMHEDATNLAHFSTAGIALGVVGLGVGTVLIVTAGSSSAATRPQREARTWTLAPSVDSRGAGLFARGRF